MSLKVVFFDAGGTLFRVRGSIGEVYATVAARHGVAAVPGVRQYRTVCGAALTHLRAVELMAG